MIFTKEGFTLSQTHKQLYLITAVGNFWNQQHLQGPIGLFQTQKRALKFANDLIQKYNPPYTWTFGDQHHPKLDAGLRLQFFTAYKNDYSAIYPTHTIYYDPNTNESDVNL